MRLKNGPAGDNAGKLMLGEVESGIIAEPGIVCRPESGIMGRAESGIIGEVESGIVEGAESGRVGGAAAKGAVWHSVFPVDLRALAVAEKSSFPRALATFEA